MIQKYQISLDPEIEEMTIEEYAVVDKDANRKENSQLTDKDYVLLFEQTYDMASIKEAIAKGREKIITELRTDQFFPAHLCSEKIADTVMALFAGKKGQSASLIYDDMETMAAEFEDGGSAESAELEN